MKISKKIGDIIEWSVAVILVIICLKFFVFSVGSSTPLGAHEQSERTFHYGPSKIIKTIDLDGSKLYLCRYKNWFSVDTVNKGVIRWYFGNQNLGVPIDKSKELSYSWGNSIIKNKVSIMKIFGYVTDKNITKVMLEVSDNKKKISINYTLDSSRMFIFYWNEAEHHYLFDTLKGLNSQGKVLYLEEFNHM